MFNAPRTLFVTLFFSVAFVSSFLHAEYTEQQRQALDDLRSALAGRQLAEIAEKKKAMLALEGDVPFEEESNRLELLSQYVTEFWNAVDKGAAASLNMGELDVDGKLCSVVDYDRQTFVIRSEGQNKRYNVFTLPPKLALVLSQLNMKKELANNKVYFGAFLTMDAKGDRRLARKYWDEAASGGVDVKFLLPELNTPQPTAPAALPELEGPARTALNPAQWQIRKKEGARYERDSIGKLGKQNEEGRMVIQSPGADDAQVISKQRINADFRCVAYFQDLAKGHEFGLYPSSQAEAAVVVPLPKGNVKVDFLRKQGVFYCRVNDQDVEVKPAADSAAKLSGYLGVSLPKEGETIVAGWQLETR